MTQLLTTHLVVVCQYHLASCLTGFDDGMKAQFDPRHLTSLIVTNQKSTDVTRCCRSSSQDAYPPTNRLYDATGRDVSQVPAHQSILKPSMKSIHDYVNLDNSIETTRHSVSMTPACSIYAANTSNILFHRNF